MTELLILKWWVLRGVTLPSVGLQNRGSPWVLHRRFSLQFCVFCVCPESNHFSASPVFEHLMDWLGRRVFFLSVLRLTSTSCCRLRNRTGCGSWADGPWSRARQHPPAPGARVRVAPGPCCCATHCFPLFCVKKWRQLKFFFPDYTKKYKDPFKIIQKGKKKKYKEEKFPAQLEDLRWLYLVDVLPNLTLDFT